MRSDYIPSLWICPRKLTWPAGPERRRTSTLPSPRNSSSPQLGGAHTTFPVLGTPIRDHADFAEGATRDVLVVTGEATGNECTRGAPQMMYVVDITDETTPQVISNYQVPEAKGDYCSQGGRFGAHSTNESRTPIYYRKIVVVLQCRRTSRGHPRPVPLGRGGSPTTPTLAGSKSTVRNALRRRSRTNNVEV